MCICVYKDQEKSHNLETSNNEKGKLSYHSVTFALKNHCPKPVLQWETQQNNIMMEFEYHMNGWFQIVMVD